MPIFELTFGKIVSLIEEIGKNILGPYVQLLRGLFLTISLIIIVLLIYFWIKLELKNKDEIDFWRGLRKNLNHYKFYKKIRQNFNIIKNEFQKDKIKGLNQINDFLDKLLDTFGYEGNLEEKLNKIDIKFLSNKEEVKKARKALILINEKLQAGEKLNLTNEEYFLIFQEYQQALFHLRAINEQDLLVMNQESQKE
jgi:uncharacterized membrane protein